MTAETNPTAGAGRMGLAWRAAEGDYIRQLRTETGLTQSELAFRVGLTNKQDISGIECGRLHVPPERVLDFADALNVPRRAFSQRLLRTQNPWLFGLFGVDRVLAEELRQAEAQGRTKSFITPASGRSV